jgi:hypothetical protein
MDDWFPLFACCTLLLSGAIFLFLIFRKPHTPPAQGGRGHEVVGDDESMREAMTKNSNKNSTYVKHEGIWKSKALADQQDKLDAMAREALLNIARNQMNTERNLREIRDRNQSPPEDYIDTTWTDE